MTTTDEDDPYAGDYEQETKETARMARLQREAEKANKRQDEFLRQQEMKRRFVGGRSAG